MYRLLVFLMFLSLVYVEILGLQVFNVVGFLHRALEVGIAFELENCHSYAFSVL